MATAKDALARNQAFLDKVVKENERLVLLCATMKQKWADAQASLSRCKAETLRELEPKLQKILDDHQLNMRNQALQFEQELRTATSPFQSEFEVMKLENDKTILQIETDCRNQLQKLKAGALAEEHRLKADLAHKLSSLPGESEQAIAIRKIQLEKERTAWQETRAAELRQEFEAKHESELRRLREKRDKLLKEVKEKLTTEAQAENRALLDEVTTNKQSHSAIEQDLIAAVRSCECEIQTIRTSASEKRAEQERLAKQLRNCECRKLRLRLDERQHTLMGLRGQLDLEKAARVESDVEFATKLAGFRANVEGIEAESAGLRLEIERAKRELEDKQADLRIQVEQLEERHRGQMELIGSRVRATVEKKDAVIQQFMDRLESIGNNSTDF
jgi:hypothetical protein